MKMNKMLFAFLATLLLGTFALLSGCASTGMDRSVKTSNSIRDVDTEIRTLIEQIDITGASLEALVAADSSNLRTAFNTYSANVDKLERQGKQVQKRVVEMRANSKEYFSEWERQGNAFTNPRIRELSEQRRATLAQIFNQVGTSSAGIAEAYRAYLTDLQEIRLFLSNDLTPAGIRQIQPITQKASVDLATLKESLVPVINALDRIKAELYGGEKK
jgi:TolA-binding protein